MGTTCCMTSSARQPASDSQSLLPPLDMKFGHMGALRITEQMTIAVTKMERHDEDFQISTDRFWALDAHWNQGCERHLVFPRTLVEFQPVVLALRTRANAAAASIGNTDEPGPALGLQPHTECKGVVLGTLL